ncbi:unnamed protein product [Protopolystoma xenopodis]|uniref:Uncharacterized protein n=1 Tax=Protopolystoma xenopodis TaxID=117903 RepID=A0A3S5ATS2_9PLAT|nr:unnamed protein product [Protopolystoma xenopodis]
MLERGLISPTFCATILQRVSPMASAFARSNRVLFSATELDIMKTRVLYSLTPATRELTVLTFGLLHNMVVHSAISLQNQIARSRQSTRTDQTCSELAASSPTSPSSAVSGTDVPFATDTLTTSPAPSAIDSRAPLHCGSFCVSGRPDGELLLKRRPVLVSDGFDAFKKD